jgi:hypothetical protein
MGNAKAAHHDPLELPLRNRNSYWTYLPFLPPFFLVAGFLEGFLSAIILGLLSLDLIASSLAEAVEKF